MTIQTTYEVKKAHSQMEVLKSSEKMIDVVNWLRKKTNPFDYDVSIFNWDGKDFEIDTETGDEFIKIWDEGQKVTTNE
jgi:hypothetical protein